jgi:hypothetical protein
MTAGIRSLPAKLALALMAIGLALSLGALNAKAADSPLTITAHIGYSDTVKTQQWMPITIVVTNSGPEVDGNLEITNSYGGRSGLAWPAIYERPVVLATGSTKYFRTYLSADPSLTVTVRIVKNGQILASQVAAGTRSASTLIGVLSDDSTALDNLAAVNPGGLRPSVVHLGLSDLVDSAPALRSFDLLVVDDFATDGLSAIQRSAIADYVQTGGHLLVGTGASWRRTVAGLPPELLPMQLNSLASLDSSPALGGLSGVQVATGSLSGGTAWLSEGSQPLLAERTIGSGSVTLATFDWKQDPIAGWTGTDPLLRKFLVRTLFGSQGQQTSASFIGGPFPGPFGGQGSSLYQRSNALSQSLGNLPALDLPSLALTGVLVLIYVLLVGPINYFVLGALHRRALSWITLPLIAVIVAAGAYGGGIWTKGQSVQANQLSIVHVEPGSGRAYLETYTGILTPTRGDYLAGTGRQPVLVSPIASYNGYGNVVRADLRVNVTDGTIGLPGMTAFTLRGFATEGIIAAPQLTGHMQLVNGQLTGTIENRSSTTFTDAVVIAGDGYQKLGALAPGASLSVGFVPKTSGLNGPPAVYGIYPNYSFGPTNGPPTNAQREGDTKTRMLMLLTGGSFKALPSSSFVPQLVAWTNQSFQDVTVNGVRPRAHSETAVAVTLPVEQVGAGLLPTGLVSGHIVDLEGTTTQQGPPGALTIQDGSVTYLYTPTLAAGLHLTGASISAANPYFGKGSGVIGNQPTTTRGEAWDWSHSTWVDIGYQDNGTTNLPDSVVNPTSGEIQLRVTVTNGSFLASGLTLTGTVQ